MPRKKPLGRVRRRAAYPGVYDRGTYWQVRIRFTDVGRVGQELKSHRSPYDPQNPESKKLALNAAIAYAAAEKKSLHKHGRPRIEVASENRLADWLTRWKEEVLDPIEAGKIGAPIKRARRVAGAESQLRKGWKQEKSVISVLLKRHAGFCTRLITDLGPDDFCGRADSLASMLRGRGTAQAAPATIRRYFAVISAVYRRARGSWGFSKVKNPIPEIEGLPAVFNERDRVIRPAEFARILVALEVADATTQAAIQFLRWTACRRSEAVSLRWENITDWDTKEPVAMFLDTKTPKLGERLHRSIMLPAEAVAALQSLLGNEKPPAQGWVFPAPKDKTKPIRGDSLTQAWERARTRAGLVAIEDNDEDTPRLHDLRHTRTTEIAKHIEALKAMKITGHRDPRTLARYYHPDAKDLGRAIARGEAGANKEKSASDTASAVEQLIEAVGQDPAMRRALIEKLISGG